MRTKAQKIDIGDRLAETLAGSIVQKALPEHLGLVPQINEVYELELAYYESQLLNDEELIRNGGYFARVGDQFTRHFLMCSGRPLHLPEHSSSRLRQFFKANQFRTGYATHGLFPYRGKFHPQMIKGLLNAMGLRPGETVLDPMMGSGTVLIEAKLMGIRSIGLDASPFCCFMTQGKINGLSLPIAPIRHAAKESRATFDYFTASAGRTGRGSQIRATRSPQSSLSFDGPIDRPVRSSAKPPKGCEAREVHDFLLLAYLDSAGYSERSSRKPPYEQFKSILERYLFVIEKIQAVLGDTQSEIAEAEPLEGDARELPLPDASVDGIVFSPPYSFAIDYLKNDAFHLRHLGTDIEDLRKRMIGLRGDKARERFDLYRSDMDRVMSECARVLRPGRICSIIVGTNSNQLSTILGIPPEEVQGIDEMLIEFGAEHGFRLIRKLERQITGMANTLRTEFIVMLQRCQ